MKNTNNPTICYKCVHRGTVPGDTHSSCKNYCATVTGNQHGIESGWFMHPFNFDPIWLLTCDGYNEQSEKMSDIIAKIIECKTSEEFTSICVANNIHPKWMLDALNQAINNV